MKGGSQWEWVGFLFFWLFDYFCLFVYVCVCVCACVYVDFRTDLQVPESSWSP